MDASEYHLRSGSQVAADLRFRTCLLFVARQSHPTRFWVCNLLEQNHEEVVPLLRGEVSLTELSALAYLVFGFYRLAIVERAKIFLRIRLYPLLRSFRLWERQF